MATQRRRPVKEAVKAARQEVRAARKRARKDGAKPKKRIRRSPEEARALILDAARKLLAEHGPAAVKLKDVAKAAGVSHGLVTHYFGTVDALVEAALEDHLRTMRARLMERLAESDGTVEAFVDELFESIAHPLYGRLLLWSMMTGRLTSPDGLPARDQGLRKAADMFEAWAEARGEKVDREALVQTLLIGLSAALGYVLGRDALWAALDEEPTQERDAQVRARLAEGLRAAMRSDV